MLVVQAGTGRFPFLKSENTKEFWSSELASQQSNHSDHTKAKDRGQVTVAPAPPEVTVTLGTITLFVSGNQLVLSLYFVKSLIFLPYHITTWLSF